jgi:hypothetical protein
MRIVKFLVENGANVNTWGNLAARCAKEEDISR